MTPPEFSEPASPRAEWLNLSALAQAEAVRRGEFTSAALVDLYLDRIERLDGQLGAFVHVQAERARRDAARKDRERASGKALPPFHGLPIAVKDLHLLRFAPARFGSRAWRFIRSPVDDLTVRALRRAGFVIVGKTSTSELALMPFVETDIHPPTRNPWNLKRISGGSSGGAAAAVAARLLPLSPGSDGGGSVRIPASLCGLVGFKPSRGVIPNPHAPVDFLGMTAIGALTRSVDDAAALCDVLCGRAPLTSGSWLSTIRQPPDRTVAQGLNIALWLDSPLEGPVATSHAAATRAAADRLTALGHRITRVPRIPVTLDEFLPIYQRLFTKTPVLFESKLQPVTAWFRREGRRYSDEDARASMARLVERTELAIREFDLVLCPTIPVATPTVGEFAHLGPEAMFRAAAPLGAFTAAWNITGRPALTLPWGRDADGLPIGVQFVGQRGADLQVLGLARALEPDPARRDVYGDRPLA